MILKHFIWVLFSAVLALGCSGCTEKQGNGPDDDGSADVGQQSRPDLMTLFYETIEAQNKVNPREKVFIVAHRANTQKGINERLPENSLEIIQAAIESGVVDMVELDVRPTKDGVLVLMHDATVDRTTNGTGKVSDKTYAQILELDMNRENDKVQTGIKVPTLKQAFELCKGKMYINLDIHSKNVPVGTLADLIKECGMIDQVMIYSKKDELLEYQSIDPNFLIHPYVSSISSAKEYEQCFGAMLFQYGLKYDQESDDFARQMRAEGYLTYTNILSQDRDMLNGNYSYLQKFVNSETDFIQTDYAELVHEFLDVEGLR